LGLDDPGGDVQRGEGRAATSIPAPMATSSASS
jgi:hypothetical protein